MAARGVIVIVNCQVDYAMFLRNGPVEIGSAKSNDWLSEDIGTLRNGFHTYLPGRPK